jgi:hypothetical protein
MALDTGAFTRRSKTWLDAEKVFIPCCFFLQRQLCDCTETQFPADLEPTLTIFCQSLYSMWLSFPHFDLFNCQFIWWLGVQIQWHSKAMLRNHELPIFEISLHLKVYIWPLSQVHNRTVSLNKCNLRNHFHQWCIPLVTFALNHVTLLFVYFCMDLKWMCNLKWHLSVSLCLVFLFCVYVSKCVLLLKL